MIQKLVGLHDLEYLLANIKIVEDKAARGGVKNPSAYLMKAIQNDYRPSKEVQIIEKEAPDTATFQISESNSINIEDVELFIDSLSADNLEEHKENYKSYLNKNPFFKKILETK